MQRSIHSHQFPTSLQVVQFAVGGRVYPQLKDWVRVTERFRGAALKRLARSVSGGAVDKFADLSAELRDEFKLFSGKTSDGIPLDTHGHAYFALLPDEIGQPTSLVCFSARAFSFRGSCRLAGGVRATLLMAISSKSKKRI